MRKAMDDSICRKLQTLMSVATNELWDSRRDEKASSVSTKLDDDAKKSPRR
jgi:hypothetical protein